MTIRFISLPARPAPIATTGLIGWIRLNLLSTPLNIGLTFLSLLLLYNIIPVSLNWLLFNATWSGGDSSACKITDANGNEVDAPGACWTFIRVRFLQLMFGLYYSGHTDQVWRPVLMFASLIALIIPLFINGFRHKMKLGAIIIFVFPFFAFALVHGEWLGLPVASSDQWGGFMLTFMLASVGIVAALPLGIVFALGRRSKMSIIRTISVFYIEMWRAAPLITVLFMASNLLPLFFPAEVDFDKVARAMVGITLFQSAYMAEAIRGGLQAIPRGQYEAADAMGMGYWKKNGLIILPQAMKVAIPGIVNTFIELFKDTTLVLIIGLFDMLRMAEAAARSSNWKGYELEAYVFSAAIYFTCCYGMSKYSQHIEAKLHTGHKR
ncbi:amino acid ABC transporter permease [Candidatus Persebacteraceae bacterium Df01]|uniref:Amino acid ABC transporter permease n=1 Tax=Candidatus Doriopsillibacter californiensis TaxID=2970740 RepID=A0ABT7QL16_9GAMM|nr:amino acid ABC transporter permease [Candidatus Persebacteraceae bacterium Df01]